MKTVYVAGPYSSDNVLGVFANMRLGINTCTRLLENGYAPFCPWLDYHYALNSKKLTLGDFYAYSLAWMAKADEVLVIGDYSKSEGTKKEIEIARLLGKPIYYDISHYDLPEIPIP